MHVQISDGYILLFSSDVNCLTLLEPGGSEVNLSGMSFVGAFHLIASNYVSLTTIYMPTDHVLLVHYSSQACSLQYTGQTHCMLNL